MGYEHLGKPSWHEALEADVAKRWWRSRQCSMALCMQCLGIPFPLEHLQLPLEREERGFGSSIRIPFVT